MYHPARARAAPDSALRGCGTLDTESQGLKVPEFNWDRLCQIAL